MFIRPRKNKKVNALSDLDDHDLIIRYKKTSDAEIIAVLFQRYTHLVYGVSLKYLEDAEDAKDAVMEIFEALMENLLLHDIRNFKSWLHSVTRNHCLMILRRKRSVRLESIDMEKKMGNEDVEFAGELHQESIFGQYTTEDLKTVLGMLSSPQRQCIELFFMNGRSYREICEETGFSYGEVKSFIQNGKRNMKLKLEAILAKKQ